MNTTAFERWFARRYPKLREAMEFGQMGPNEVWLYNATKEAFAAGQLSTEEEAHGQQESSGDGE